MKAIVTGSHGAVAPYVIKELIKRNIEVIIFDRSKVDILSYDEVYNFIKNNQVDLFFHIATGDLLWLEHITKACKILNVKLIFTSSVSVFSEKGSGPYYIDSIPNSQEDYGIYKYQGEKITAKYSNSLIVRLGWQIGYETNSNNMYDFLVRQQKEKGYIEASTLWYPSCSFLDVTSKILVDLSLSNTGLFQLNSNKNLNFYQIVLGINKKFDCNFKVIPTTSLNRDDRMYDDRIEVETLCF